MSDWTTDPGLVPPHTDDPTRPGDSWWSGTADVTTQLPSTPPLDAPHGPPPTPPLPPQPAPSTPSGRADGTPGRRRVLQAGVAVFVALALLAGGFALGRSIDDGSGATSSTPLASPRTTVPRTTVPSTTTPGNGSSAGASAGSSSTTSAAPSGTQTTTPATTGTAPALDPSLEPAAAAAKAIKPAVVQLETDQGLGSGFIFDTNGNILTAAHVVGNASTVTVRMGDGHTLTGQVLGADPNTDVAVVKVDPTPGMPVAALALNDPLQVGQGVLAVGSPFGLDQTVTAGIVSSVNRPVEVNRSVVAMVQTDASINPGNSGGALVDMKGRVIGINDQIASNSGDNAGVGFAIPIDTAYDVAQRIINHESLDVGFLGIASGDDPSDGEPGALVTMVTPNSPASSAGIKVGDIINAIDGNPVRSYMELVAQVRRHRPNDKIELKLRRGGDTITADVTLGKR